MSKSGTIIKKMPRKIEVSHKTIVFTVIFLLFLWVLYFIRDIILTFFLALLIMAVFDPLVTKLTQYKIPRGASVLLAYLLLFSVIGFSIAAVVPPLIEQTSSFINNLPRFLDTLGLSAIVSEQLVQQTVNQVGTLPGKIVNATVSLFSNFLGIIAILVFAYYLLSERDDLKKQIVSWIGEKNATLFEKRFNMSKKNLACGQEDSSL